MQIAVFLTNHLAGWTDANSRLSDQSLGWLD